MNPIKKLKSIYQYLNLAFEKQFGWFFINGRKGAEELTLEAN